MTPSDVWCVSQAILAAYGLVRLAQWLIATGVLPGTSRVVFWTCTRGRIWRDKGGVLVPSRLTDALQDYLTEASTGRAHYNKGPVTLHEEDSE